VRLDKPRFKRTGIFKKQMKVVKFVWLRGREACAKPQRKNSRYIHTGRLERGKKRRRPWREEGGAAGPSLFEKGSIFGTKGKSLGDKEAKTPVKHKRGGWEWRAGGFGQPMSKRTITPLKTHMGELPGSGKRHQGKSTTKHGRIRGTSCD